MTPRSGPATLLPVLAVLAALMSFMALLDAAYIGAGAVFEYPLDDPYIHMAMAEQMAAGGYGVNPGEYAAAASSPLFPVLLMPFAGTELQRYLPLVWNIVGLLAAAWLWGRILWQAGYGASALGAGLALAGPLALNMSGLAFVGMEHMLHVAASLAIVSGLVAVCDDRRVGWLLLAGILLAPLLRFEGLALAILAASVVMVRGRFGTGLVALALAVLPVAGFAWFLTSLGLDPLPSSVTAKLAGPDADAGLLAKLSTKLYELAYGPRQRVLGLFLLVGVVLALRPQVLQSGRWPVLFAVMGAGVAHLVFGRFGWMNRYEIYVLCALGAGLLAVAAVPGPRRLGPVLLAALPMVFSGWFYLGATIQDFPPASRAVYLQQGQMARLAKMHFAEPVAVNDLGWVAWANPDYVLDLWGLANHDARRIRLGQPGPGWVDGLTDARDVRVAMIYEGWFPEALGDDWVLLGRLKMTGPKKYLGGDTVSIFLTRPLDTAPFVLALRDWQQGLPEGASFEFAEGLDG